MCDLCNLKHVIPHRTGVQSETISHETTRREMHGFCYERLQRACVRVCIQMVLFRGYKQKAPLPVVVECVLRILGYK